MFLAKNEQGRIVNVLDEDVKKGRYTCPMCQREVQLKNGRVMRTHFAHLSLSDCQFYSENESSEHLNVKATFYRWAKKDHSVQIEHYLSEIQQIADVFIGNQVALEVQCSSLSKKRLKERTSSYHRKQYHVIWLLGKQLWLTDRIRQLQYDFLYFSQSLGFYLWEVDENCDLLRLKYMIHEDLHGKAHYLVKEFPFERGDLLEVLRYPYLQRKLQTLIGKQDESICDYVRKQLYYQTPKWMKKQEEAYLVGKNLLEKTLEDYYPQISPPMRKSFVQISKDISWYNKAFETYYRRQKYCPYQILYSPVFYL